LAAPAAPILALRGITKRFGALTANDDISLSLREGEVLALLGENGAGKSTLVSILFGHYLADGGSIEVFGQPLPPGSPHAALAAGIGMVHQHFTLADNLSVLDNILLGTEPLLAFSSRRGAAQARVRELAQKFGLGVDPPARVGTLSVGEKQRVEILKALYRNARVLILDEPTAVLTPQEVDSLFATLRQMVADGMSVIFISHKLDEVLVISDRVAVLRGGRLVAEQPARGATKAQLAELMVGREVRMPRREPGHGVGDVLLSLRGVTTAPAHGRAGLDAVDLDVRAGEIVAIAGVAGNGQEVLADLLSGLLAPSGGSVRALGRAIAADPHAWVEAGVGRVPEDRQGAGVVGDLPVWKNAILERYREPRYCRAGLMNNSAARAQAGRIVERFDVRLPGIDAPARSLSGGNIQKLILGRALSDSPRILVVNQPTWGLDVGAVSFIHGELLAARRGGAAIVLISEDLDEVFALADRIAVMHRGSLTPARPAEQWTPASIGLAMAGTRAAEAAATPH
jgi:simple sugar transport system ATP-binding protein